MLQENYHIESEAELEALPARLASSREYCQARTRLVQFFTFCVPLPRVRRFVKSLRRNLPEAVLVGVSSTVAVNKLERIAGRPDGRGADNPEAWFIDVNCCYFDSSSLEVRYLDAAEANDSDMRRSLVSAWTKKGDLRGVEVFYAGIGVHIGDFLTDMSEGLPTVPFFGMGAGFIHLSDEQAETKDYFVSSTAEHEGAADWPSNQLLCVQGQFFPYGVALLLFSGQELHIEAQYLFGWHPIGKYLEAEDVTDGIYVGKIGGMAAADAYKKYLGVPLDKYFNMNILEFPLVIRRKGLLLGRIPLSIKSDSKQICFPGDVREHEKMRFSYANQQEILAETWKASEVLNRLHPEALHVFACASRQMFLQEKACEEVEDFARFQPQMALHHGMGEIYAYRGKGGILAGALILAAMWECSHFSRCFTADVMEPVALPQQEAKMLPLNVRLAHFLRATSEDLAEYATEVKAQASKAEAASVAKSNFLSNMSHEIRTPINAIIGLNEMILRESEEENIRQYAENVSGAAAHLLGLVNDILDFSKIEAGKMEILPVEYATTSLLNDLVNMVMMRVLEKGLELKLNISSELPSLLRGDEVRLKQVVMNILTNAVKYTEEGSVTFCCRSRTLSVNKVALRFEVEDTGIGIKEEDLPKLFAAFERIEETRNRTVEGTGLGMNITQRLLEMMGSRLEVRSTYGKGSNFAFELEQEVVDWQPLGDFVASLQSGHAQSQQRKESSFIAPLARILVVDDTPMNLKVMQSLLKRTKMRVDTVGSGEECLHAVQKVAYDMIFLDHRMPGMDGIETLQRLNVMEHLSRDAPVVALTANALAGVRESYLQAGFNEYLSKPIDSAKLESLLMEYLPAEKITRVRMEAAAPREETLPGWLREIDGLQVEAGLQSCGSPESYLDALQIFRADLPASIETIRKHFEAEDWKNYTIKVHALKSSARIIGAKRLAKMAERLEVAGDAGRIEEIRRDTEQLLERCRGAMTKLAPLSAEPEREGEPLSAEEVAEVYGALQELAASFDYDNIMAMQEDLAGRSPSEGKEKWQAVWQAARRPDWEKLQELLKE